jgi:hypothetical protein
MPSRKRKNKQSRSKTAIRTDERLWKRVKEYVKWNYREYGKWSAFKSAISVNLYKQRGGRYRGSRSPANSMKKWLGERWRRIDSRDPNSRFLPDRVIRKMSPELKRRENSRKRKSRSRGKSKARYSPQLNRLMHRMRIY